MILLCVAQRGFGCGIFAVYADENTTKTKVAKNSLKMNERGYRNDTLFLFINYL